MITKEELKREVDKVPENLLQEVFALLKRVILQNKSAAGRDYDLDKSWKKWKNSLEKFTPDFMDKREQPTRQSRELFD